MEFKMLFVSTLILISILFTGYAGADSCENDNCSSSIDIPLVSKLNAPLKAELDISNLTKQLREVIQKEVKVAVSKEMKDLVENILNKRIQTALNNFGKSYNLTLSTFKQKIEGKIAKDCNDVHKTMNKSGVYHIYPTGVPGYKVYCDMDTDGGGWTVFQYRSGGVVSFHTKLWEDYKNGFGEVNGDHWLGNDRVHQLTGLGNNVLRIYFEDWEGNSRYAVFNSFSLGDEVSNYILSYGSYSGNAGNSLVNNVKFTTADRQNDGRPKGDNCVKDHYGGPWWYNYGCGLSDLNGEYVNGGKGVSSGRGVFWHGWKGWSSSMKVTKMMIRKK